MAGPPPRKESIMASEAEQERDAVVAFIGSMKVDIDAATAFAMGDLKQKFIGASKCCQDIIVALERCHHTPKEPDHEQP